MLVDFIKVLTNMFTLGPTPFPISAKLRQVQFKIGNWKFLGIIPATLSGLTRTLPPSKQAGSHLECYISQPLSVMPL